MTKLLPSCPIFRRTCCSMFLTLALVIGPTVLYGQLADTYILKRDSLKAVVDAAPPAEKTSRILDLFNHVFPSEIDLAQHVCNLAAQSLQVYPNDTLMMDHLLNQGDVLNYLGKFDSMFVINPQGLVIAKKLNSRSRQCDFLNNLGITFERIGNLDSALFYYHQSLELNDHHKYKAYNNLGRAYNRKGDAMKGIEYLQLAMLGAREKGKINVEAVVANNIGSCYADFGNKEKAIEYFKRSVKLKEQIGDKRGMLFALSNLATCFDTPLENKKYADQGKQIADEIGHTGFQLMFTENLARISYDQGHYQEGYDQLRPAYDRAKVSPGPEFGAILYTLGLLSIKLEKIEEAEIFAKEYYDLAFNIKSEHELQKARELLLAVYTQNRNYQQYFEIANAYYPLRDSTNNLDRLNKFNELESQLDEEQKEKVALLNSTIKEKEKSQLRLGIIGLLIASILLLLLYLRNKRIKFQKLTIEKEKEVAKELTNLNTKLKEVDQFKSRLYTNISHEFRTPLTVILGMTQQLESNHLLKTAARSDETIGQKLTYIQRNGKSLLDLVNKMLDLSKLEDHTLSVQYIQSDIVAYLHYLGQSFQSLIETRNLHFTLESSQDEIIMDYDPEKMRQIIANLMSNAIKYTPPNGNIKLSIDQHDSMLEIVLSDTGHGISEENQAHVFDRFYQADDAVSKSGGTGIGLALTKELVELLGGSIAVQSQLGEGSRFTVHLPITNEHEISSEVLESDIAKSNLADEVNVLPPLLTLSDKPTVLVIEDNSDVAEYISSCLRDEYSVDVRYDGQSGVEHALDTIPDLVISDIMMPEKDGYEVCELLKLDPRTSHIPVILLTAKAAHEERMQGLETGADEYLIKPFDPKELEVRVRKLIELRQTLREQYASSDLLKAPVANMSTVDKNFIENVRNSIEQHLDDNLYGVDNLAQDVNMSKVHLNRKLKALMDLSANKLIQAIRLQRAYDMLRQKAGNVTEISVATGFNTTSYFTRCFREKYNKTPSQVLDGED